jgi:signal transduction histidine kinase
LLQGGEDDLVESLLSALAKLQVASDQAPAEAVAVEAVERALSGAAAAVFAVALDTGLLTLRAAGPRWRTAERDRPAWLSPLAADLAAAARAPQVLRGRLTRLSSIPGGIDLVHVPLRASDWRAGALVVVWSPTSPARSADFWWVERFGAHLQLALRGDGQPADAQADTLALQAAQAEFVRVQQLRALGALARGVVHDLNNGLTTILGLSEWLGQTPGLEAETRGDIEALRRAGHQVKRLADNLDFLARQGRPAAIAPLNLADLLSDALACLQGEPVAGSSGGIPAIDVSKAGPAAIVRGDYTLLRGLICELLRSAVQATPPGAHVEVQLLARTGTARLSITDHGTAFDEAARCELFEPIYTKTRAWPGLTLAACWGVADSHGGCLEAQVLSGGGRRVVLTLPTTAA